MEHPADRRHHPRHGRRRARPHADRNPPRGPAHRPRLLGIPHRKGHRDRTQIQPADPCQRLALRPRIRRRHHPRPAARRRRRGKARTHDLRHDQLLPSEDGRHTLCRRPIAPPGQEHARNRGPRNRRAHIPSRHGHELRPRGVFRRKARHPDQPPGGRDGVGRHPLRRRGGGGRDNHRPAGRGVSPRPGQEPPLGTGAQHRAD